MQSTFRKSNLIVLLCVDSASLTSGTRDVKLNSLLLNSKLTSSKISIKFTLPLHACWKDSGRPCNTQGIIDGYVLTTYSSVLPEAGLHDSMLIEW